MSIKGDEGFHLACQVGQLAPLPFRQLRHCLSGAAVLTVSHPPHRPCHQQRTQANLVGRYATSICNELNTSQNHIA